ncbi:hypothetical protein GCM10010174_69800 [Kutzneria viridogrisea]
MPDSPNCPCPVGTTADCSWPDCSAGLPKRLRRTCTTKQRGVKTRG